MKYDDIIDLPHHVSKRHPQMSMENRAAQFAPFAALTGYEAAIRETGRWTDFLDDMSESEANILDRQLENVINNEEGHPMASEAFFVPDERKECGQFETFTGGLTKIDDL